MRQASDRFREPSRGASRESEGARVMERRGLQVAVALTVLIALSLTAGCGIVRYKKRVETSQIEFKIVRKADPNLPKGMEVVDKPGETGVKEVVFQDTFAMGRLLSSTKKGTKIVRPAVDKVILFGQSDKATGLIFRYGRAKVVVANVKRKTSAQDSSGRDMPADDYLTITYRFDNSGGDVPVALEGYSFPIQFPGCPNIKSKTHGCVGWLEPSENPSATQKTAGDTSSKVVSVEAGAQKLGSLTYDLSYKKPGKNASVKGPKDIGLWQLNYRAVFPLIKGWNGSFNEGK